MKILCLGDIVGKPGRDAVITYLELHKKEYDFIVCNGENSAGGFGINISIAKSLFDAGVDVITTGNHIWKQREIYDYLNKEPRILRPHNYSRFCPGKGVVVTKSKSGRDVAVINIQGSVFMEPSDNAFTKVDELLKTLSTSIVIVDFHAEATSEKVAMGWFLDGKVSLVFGTHTHVQTADERVLLSGTGYITDLGMCGSYDSVIGMERESIVRKFLTNMPSKFEVASENIKVSGVSVEVDDKGKCVSIKRVLESIL